MQHEETLSVFTAPTQDLKCNLLLLLSCSFYPELWEETYLPPLSSPHTHDLYQCRIFLTVSCLPSRLDPLWVCGESIGAAKLLFRITSGTNFCRVLFILSNEKSRSRLVQSSIYLDAMKSNSIAMGSHVQPRPSNSRSSQESPWTDGECITYSHHKMRKHLLSTPVMFQFARTKNAQVKIVFPLTV